MTMLKWIARTLATAAHISFGIFVAFALVVGGLAYANYTATQGAGTNFGSIVVGGVHYAMTMLCDATAGTTCATVKAGSTAPLATDPAVVVSLSQNSAGIVAPGPAAGAASAPAVVATDNGAIALWGQGATAASVPANAVQQGCRAASALPTEVTGGQLAAVQCSLGGKVVTQPFALKEVQVRGSAVATASTGAQTIIASAGGSLKNYITDWECSNTSATSVIVTFSDAAATIVIVPAGGGNNKSLNTPIVTAAATAFTFASGTSVSSVYCSAQGYTGL